VHKTQGTLDIRFLVTDFKHTVPVTYSGILPDLFREGQGVVAHGRIRGGVFVADEILAKHDEKYMPPEVARSLKDNPPPAEAVPEPPQETSRGT
jgi:cytochrome c-type biogenesis protein CcmE